MGTKELIYAKESRILELKTYLTKTDYYDHKAWRGDEVDENIMTSRVEAVAEINSLEAEIITLTEQLKEEENHVSIEN